MYRDAAMSLRLAFEQNKGFFVARIPYLHERLRYLVRRCRQQRHAEGEGHPVLQLQEELLRLFGVHVQVPIDRQLSVLASAIRHVLVAGAHLHRQVGVKGGVRILIDEMQQQLQVSEKSVALDLLKLDAKIEQLSQWFPGVVCILELRYFACLGLRDVAQELGVSIVVLKRDLRFAKAWLLASLQPSNVAD